MVQKLEAKVKSGLRKRNIIMAVSLFLLTQKASRAEMAAAVVTQNDDTTLLCELEIKVKYSNQ